MDASSLPTRKRNRLEGYDYTQAGGYAVTICVQDRRHLFGKIHEGRIVLSPDGEIVKECIDWIGEHFARVTVDESMVMPNHIHMILILHDEGSAGGSRAGGSRTAPTERRKTLGRIVGAFKTVSTKRINLRRRTPGEILWQRSFHDHIVRDQNDLDHHRAYIQNNPANWELDTEYSIL